MAKAGRRITIEQDDTRLRVIAEPPPLWPVYLAAAGVILLCGNILRMLWPMYQREMRSYYGWPALYVGVASVVVISHLADLALYRRSGGSVTAVRWVAPDQLTPAIDRINALLLIDRFNGFEVVVRGLPYELIERPAAGPPSLPAARPGAAL